MVSAATVVGAGSSFWVRSPPTSVFLSANSLILEGLLTCVVGLLFYFVISDFPEEVKWLTAEERQFVKERLQEDVGESQRHKPLTVKEVFSILREWKIILGGLMYFGLIVPAYGYGQWIHPPLDLTLSLILNYSILRACNYPIIGTQQRPHPTLVCTTLGLRLRLGHDHRDDLGSHPASLRLHALCVVHCDHRFRHPVPCPSQCAPAVRCLVLGCFWSVL